MSVVMKNLVMSLMFGAAVVATNPLFAMDEDPMDQEHEEFYGRSFTILFHMDGGACSVVGELGYKDAVVTGSRGIQKVWVHPYDTSNIMMPGYSKHRRGLDVEFPCYSTKFGPFAVHKILENAIKGGLPRKNIKMHLRVQDMPWRDCATLGNKDTSQRIGLKPYYHASSELLQNPDNTFKIFVGIFSENPHGTGPSIDAGYEGNVQINPAS